MVEADLNLVSKLSRIEKQLENFRLRCICPLDGKYGKKVDPVRDYLTSDAEWKTCAYIQRELLAVRVDWGLAGKENLREVDRALKKISPLNMALLEDLVTKHDQLAVIEEIGRYVSPETKALLHPGTTSYDILDTARSYLYKKAWNEVIRPKIAEGIDKLCLIAEQSMKMLQVGRTHLQDTSPVLLGGMLAGYAARLAERVQKCDYAVNDLRGKISGIVGTGASIEMVIGRGKSLKFERTVLQRLGLKADRTATQIVQKEKLSDFGHGIVTLMDVLGDFANDVRQMYSSAIKEVTSRDNAARLGGSSAAPGKNNPIEYENIGGSDVVARSGMSILYALIQSDFQRDLTSSVEARYQPGMMMAQTYESFSRITKALHQFSINEDRLAANLEPIRQNPDEAMTAITRGSGWIHTKYGVGHEFVKEMVKQSKKENLPLLQVCMKDQEFEQYFNSLPRYKQNILNGELEFYTGHAAVNGRYNIKIARRIIGGTR